MADLLMDLATVGIVWYVRLLTWRMWVPYSLLPCLIYLLFGPSFTMGLRIRSHRSGLSFSFDFARIRFVVTYQQIPLLLQIAHQILPKLLTHCRGNQSLSGNEVFDLLFAIHSVFGKCIVYGAWVKFIPIYENAMFDYEFSLFSEIFRIL